MSTANHPWEAIYQSQGRVFQELLPVFDEIVCAFQKHGCSEILDLGCGNGRHTVHSASRGFHLTGLDISPTALRLAQEWLAEEAVGAALLQADMRAPLPFKTGAFDGVLSTQVIHHALLAEVLRTIGEIWRVLTPGGVAFVTVSGRMDDDVAFREIEPDTFVPLDGPEAGLPHHIFTEDSLRSAFDQFLVSSISRRAEGKVLAILVQKPMVAS